jgi:hypothetical protein
MNIIDLVGQPTSSIDDDDGQLDRAAIDRDIAVGARAFTALLKNAGLDWSHWSEVIVGLRGLRSLAFAMAGTSKMSSQVYRDAMRGLLSLSKYSVYDQIKPQDRSDCYRLMDRLDEVDTWYAGLAADDKLRWKHPGAIAKHCPRQFLSGGMRQHNHPPKSGQKKPAVTAETERLRALLIHVIKRLAGYEPKALDLLDQIIPADPDDQIDDVHAEDEAEVEPGEVS